MRDTRIMRDTRKIIRVLGILLGILMGLGSCKTATTESSAKYDAGPSPIALERRYLENVLVPKLTDVRSDNDALIASLETVLDSEEAQRGQRAGEWSRDLLDLAYKLRDSLREISNEVQRQARAENGDDLVGINRNRFETGMNRLRRIAEQDFPKVLSDFVSYQARYNEISRGEVRRIERDLFGSLEDVTTQIATVIDEVGSALTAGPLRPCGVLVEGSWCDTETRTGWFLSQGELGNQLNACPVGYELANKEAIDQNLDRLRNVEVNPIFGSRLRDAEYVWLSETESNTRRAVHGSCGRRETTYTMKSRKAYDLERRSVVSRDIHRSGQDININCRVIWNSYDYPYPEYPRLCQTVGTSE